MLVDLVDLVRIDAGRRLNAERQAELGQFLTPASTAKLMASMFDCRGERVRLLDAGAGVGSLTAAWVSEIVTREQRPREVRLTAFEVDDSLALPLSDTLNNCRQTLESAGIRCHIELRRDDFIEWGVAAASGGLFAPNGETFDAAILNPPYRKFTSESRERALLRQLGVETSNLYTAFLTIAVKLLAPGGELVAITPRSFCNGPYFKPFRRLLIESLQLRRVHVFESRKSAFREDDVLQENIIFHGAREAVEPHSVEISSSAGPDDDHVAYRNVPYDQVVRKDDPNLFIHLPGDEVQEEVASRVAGLPCTLADLDLTVSTGRVVDFRATELLQNEPDSTTVPLIYPTHFDSGFVRWPKQSKKPNALKQLPGANELLIPNETYVLVKRFSAKEERRRIVAAIHDPARVPGDRVGFENHLNYFHKHGGGLPTALARGLAVYLNSTLVDLFFRQFNGHTQVNATDLRSLRYPDLGQLTLLGSGWSNEFPKQEQIDERVRHVLFPPNGDDPVKTARRLSDALSVLKDLGFPRAQINERSALTLLALLNLKPTTPWRKATAPLIGITPMMDFFAAHYGKRYKPNTRETVRRQTVHQFLEAGLAVINPDSPSRPTNSPNSVYQIEAGAIKLLRSFGGPSWDKGLRAYSSSVSSLRQKYAHERQLHRIPVKVSGKKEIALSPGGQNVLIKHIVTEFAARFAPGGRVIYVGDADNKFAHYDAKAFGRLGLQLDSHGKMPDVIVHHSRKGWLLLIEAVTSHGPVSAKRKGELTHLFRTAHAGLVFVTAFLDRKSMLRHLGDISWETEVWVADAPDHLIHFDGKRFLGPYSE